MASDNITVLVLMAAVLLRLLLIGGVIWWIIPRRSVCPHCSDATFGLETSPMALRFLLEKRWCPCGWSGLSKRVTS